MVDQKLIRILKNIAFILDFNGENPFKSRAYTNAADLIEENELDVHYLVKENKINEIEGFGKALQEKISDYVLNGTMSYYEKLSLDFPLGLIEIGKISGIGPKKVQAIYNELNIEDTEQLLEAAQDGKLKLIKGFSDSLIKAIISEITNIKTKKSNFYYHIAYSNAIELLNLLKNLNLTSKTAISGQLYRGEELINKVTLIAICNSFEEIIKNLVVYKNFNRIGGNLSFKNEEGLSFEIISSSEDNFYIDVHKYSGSSSYNQAFDEFLIYKNINQTETGLFQNNEPIVVNSEKELFQNLSLQFIIPELRENPQVIQFANQSQIPELIEETDMRGMLHCHSTWSDGRNSLEEMAIATRDLGFSYFAICDHSRTPVYANGLSIERVLEQHREIDKLNAKNLGITILKGIESDILPDGSLDYPDEILAKFDIVVASVHSSMKMPINEMTERILKALSNPYTTILGHGTGRILNKRESYPLDVKALIDYAAVNNKIIELNASPQRLDLSWEWLQYAKQKMVKIAINPDAHNVLGLKHVAIGVKFARKAWLEAKDVVNTYSLERFRSEICNKKG